MYRDNPFSRWHIEFHILQSFPVTCLNRDDVGSPKTAVVGGVARARVSSQCWKRQVRMSLKELGIKLAVRTKKVAEYVSDQCKDLGANDQQAQECGEAIGTFLTKDTLHFFTEREAKAFAEYAKKQGFLLKKKPSSTAAASSDSKKSSGKDSPKKMEKKHEGGIKKIAKKALNPAVDGLDIALFGRMVAQAATLNVEAAASFAHAISTHKANNEIDFFTALDDLKPYTDPGASHIGTLEFNSATYYRYVSLNLGQLWETLAVDEDTITESVADDIAKAVAAFTKAVAAFTKALYIAVPSARQTTQSGASLWDYAKVLVRRGPRMQLSFDEPVKQRGGGYLKPSIERLEQELKDKCRMVGTVFSESVVGKSIEYTLSQEDEGSTLGNLLTALDDGIRAIWRPSQQ